MVDTVLLKAISEDRVLGASILFSHRHSHPSPAYHIEITDAWRAADEFVLIEAYRGGAKTTLAEEFLLLEACFGNFFYALLIGETYAKACQTLEAIAFEATHNEKLTRLFGRVLARKPIENKVWFRSGALIEAVGWEQEFRAFKYHNRRPDRAYLDDIENAERVRDSAAVDATMAKLYRQLRPAMDRVNRKIRWSQTPLAPDCGVTRVRNQPGWVCLAFPIVVGEIEAPGAQTLWPERYPIEWVRAERDAYAKVGQLREFNQEFMLIADSAEAKPFREDMLAFADMVPAAWLPRHVILDPSRTASATKSDRTGKVVVSKLGSSILVHESWGGYPKPSEIVRDAFDTAERHHAVQIAVEKNSLDDWLMEPMRHEMMRRGCVIEVTALQAPQDRDKNAFIMGLQPFMRAKEVILVGGRTAHAQLIAEILNFPSGSLDVVNALAYALKLFAGVAVYEDFGEDNVAQAHEPVKGEKVYLAWNASASETVCVALLRSGRHVSIARDFGASGAVSDAARAIAVEVRANFPRSAFEAYVPEQLFDEVRRVALAPAIRAAKMNVFRGAHTTLSRGALAERIRSKIKGRALLTVAKDAPLTLAALAQGYKFELKEGARLAPEPQPGVSRLIGEAIESLIFILDRGMITDELEGNFNFNPQGVKYRSALPQRR